MRAFALMYSVLVRNANLALHGGVVVAIKYNKVQAFSNGAAA